LRYLQERAAKNDSNYKKRLRAYRIAVAKEKNNLYKSIEVEKNIGFKIGDIVLSNNSNSTSFDLTTYINSKIGSCNINDIEKVEIVIDGVENKTNGVYSDKMELIINGTQYGEQIISTTSSSGYITLSFNKEFSSTDVINQIILRNEKPKTTYSIASIKFYYK